MERAKKVHEKIITYFVIAWYQIANDIINISVFILIALSMAHNYATVQSIFPSACLTIAVGGNYTWLERLETFYYYFFYLLSFWSVSIPGTIDVATQ